MITCRNQLKINEWANWVSWSMSHSTPKGHLSKSPSSVMTKLNLTLQWKRACINKLKDHKTKEHCLPAALRTATLSPLAFARHLKTHLFDWNWQRVWGLFRTRYKNMRIIIIIKINIARIVQHPAWKQTVPAWDKLRSKIYPTNRKQFSREPLGMP